MSQEMMQLASHLPSVLARARAPATLKKYAACFQRWRTWAVNQGVAAVGADSFHVALYLVKLINEARTAAPITSAVCSISWMHKSHGLADPCANDVVANVHQAAKRILACPKNRKQPLSKSVLRKLSKEYRRSESLQDLQVMTLLAIGFAGLLRWNDLTQLRVDEVLIKNQYAAVFLEVRKNDQLRHGNWIFIARSKGEACPVHLLEELVARGGHLQQSPLFGKISQHRGKKVIRGQMSYSRARELVRCAVSRVGEDPNVYGLHSLRSGGATAAAAAGIPDRLIQRQGGWRSEKSMRMYFSESLPNMLRVSRCLAV
eukprot:scpid21935/ scgid11781/ Integrase/recombinase xerD homolog